MDEFDDFNEWSDEHPVDLQEVDAREFLKGFFDKNRAQVYFSRQLEVRNEQKYFHWITNRAIRYLEEDGRFIRTEARKLSTGTSIKLVWHKSFRFYKRSAARLVNLVEEYADPIVGAALGLHGETMVLEAFARNQFVMRGRHSQEYDGKVWNASGHDLDFIFERDGVAYGVEVKNTLGYMDNDEFLTKIRLCQTLGIRPVFVVRMIPRSWIYELSMAKGFALILKYQLYPWSHHQLARKVATELDLPVDAPKAIAEGTMARFMNWHSKHV